jgi:conserved hypothetical protein
MSFSSNVKAELCRENPVKKCCALAECYGILLYANTFSAREIRIITENASLASRLKTLFKKAFGFGFDEISEGGERRSFIITDKNKISKIFDAYGFDVSMIVSHHINFGVLEEECCKISFMRGAFLAGGSVTSPAKRYHLELVTDHMSVSRETYSLLLEMGFSPKESSRSGNYVAYFKQSEAIEDFLTTIGAPISAMEVMSEKIEKDMRNAINRRVNCDSANADKIVAASREQLMAIRLVDKRIGLMSLPDKLRETAFLRVANPEASMSELAQLSVPPVTKSCLSHRMRKLLAYTKEE